MEWSMNSPTPEEVKAARKKAGLTQTEAANLIYYTLSGWQKAEDGSRKMSKSAWELFLLKTGGKNG